MLNKIHTKLALILFSIAALLYGGYVYQNRDSLGNLFVEPVTEMVQAQQEVAEPSRIVIPKLGIETAIEYVGEDEHGRMDVPQNVDNVAWWQHGAKPGEKGSAVLAGHVDTPDGQFGVFYPVDQLEHGDSIIVYDVEGIQHTFQVTLVQRYKDAEFPLDIVFERDDKKRLNLITCSGSFDISAQNYEDRLVVFAEAIE